MTPEQIKQQVEQEAEKLFKMDTTTHAWNDPYSFDRKKTQEQYNSQQQRRQEIFKAGAAFVLETLLPSILQEEKRKAFEAVIGIINNKIAEYPRRELAHSAIRGVLGYVIASIQEYKSSNPNQVERSKG